MSNICFIVRLFPVFFDRVPIVWVILHHSYRCLQCKRHKHSPISQNVCRCLSLHLLRIGFASSALDHSPCARMIWILTTCRILLRCKNSSHRFQQWICPCAVRSQRVSPFYLPSIHQISTLCARWSGSSSPLCAHRASGDWPGSTSVCGHRTPRCHPCAWCGACFLRARIPQAVPCQSSQRSAKWKPRWPSSSWRSHRLPARFPLRGRPCTRCPNPLHPPSDKQRRRPRPPTEREQQPPRFQWRWSTLGESRPRTWCVAVSKNFATDLPNVWAGMFEQEVKTSTTLEKRGGAEPGVMCVWWPSLREKLPGYYGGCSVTFGDACWKKET